MPQASSLKVALICSIFYTQREEKNERKRRLKSLRRECVIFWSFVLSMALVFGFLLWSKFSGFLAAFFVSFFLIIFSFL
ncbi:hypothetical protein NC651_021714 [Populus alba x Populus x berolinensis]|nr:hypothetical protein NC651_021714 [Populus alba x Populus x berolinensis]